MNAGTVTVEPVPPQRRTGRLDGVAYVVTQRYPDGSMAVHLPGSDDERAMPLPVFGQRVAESEGAVWVPPPPWIPGVVDDYADVVEDGNGRVRNRHVRRPARAGVVA